MNDQEIDDLLKSVPREEPPPFLFTRIEGRLVRKGTARRTQFRFVVLALAVLVLANAAVLQRTLRYQGRGIDDLARSITGSPSNQLYE